MKEELTRAMAAYFRSGGIDQSDSYTRAIEEHKGLRYVVLRNVGGVLAVYRITNSGPLKRLRRYPKTFTN